jgi:hypothetical protein
VDGDDTTQTRLEQNAITIGSAAVQRDERSAIEIAPRASHRRKIQTCRRATGRERHPREAAAAVGGRL